MSPIGSFFRNKWVWLTLATDVAVIIFIMVNLAINAGKTSIIEFNIVPADSQILVNGKNYANGSYYITPGVYNIEISHDNLNTKNMTVDLEKQGVASITTFLHQGDNFSFYELKENYDSYLMLEEIASSGNNMTTDHDISAEKFISDFQKNYELYQTKLPVTYSEYDDDGKLAKYISVRSNNECVITLCLKAVIRDKDDVALVDSLLVDTGFNLEYFEIGYKIY